MDELNQNFESDVLQTSPENTDDFGPVEQIIETEVVDEDVPAQSTIEDIPVWNKVEYSPINQMQDYKPMT